MNFFRGPPSGDDEPPRRYYSGGIRSSSGGAFVRPGRRSREAAKERDKEKARSSRGPPSEDDEPPRRHYHSTGIRSSSGGAFVRPGPRSREAAKEREREKGKEKEKPRSSRPHHPHDLPHHPKPHRRTSGSYQHPHSATDLRDGLADLVDDFARKLAQLEAALRAKSSWVDLRGAFPPDKDEARLPFGDGTPGGLSGWVVFDLTLIRSAMASERGETYDRRARVDDDDDEDEGLPGVSSGGYDFAKSKGAPGPAPQRQPSRSSRYE